MPSEMADKNRRNGRSAKPSTAPAENLASKFIPLLRGAKLTRRLQNRVSEEDFLDLEFFATQRREKVGTLTSRLLRTFAMVIRRLRENFSPDQKIINVGGHSVFPWHDCVLISYDFRIGGETFSGQLRDDDPTFFRKNALRRRMLKLLPNLNAVDRFLESMHPDLGVSPYQALEQFRFKEVERVIRKWERQVRAVRKNVAPSPAQSQAPPRAAAENP
jgi:hypothetical protein